MTPDQGQNDTPETPPGHFLDDPSDMPLFLGGSGSVLLDHLGGLSAGFLTASQHGVDITVRKGITAPTHLGEDGHLWWPEAGLRLDPASLTGIFAHKKQHLSGAACLEFDFMHKPAGFSISCLPGHPDHTRFVKLVDSLAVEPVSRKILTDIRRRNTPSFNTCPCCRARGEYIRNHTDSHPAFLILKSLSEQETEAEFHVSTAYIDMLNSWTPNEVVCANGEITVSGEEHHMILDASLIHTLHIASTTRRNQPHSLLRCYHSKGDMIFEITVPGHMHAGFWHEVCANSTSYYRSNGDETYW